MRAKMNMMMGMQSGGKPSGGGMSAMEAANLMDQETYKSEHFVLVIVVNLISGASLMLFLFISAFLCFLTKSLSLL